MNPRLILFFNRWIPRITYLAYPLALIYLAVNRDQDFWPALLAPAISFVLVTLMRKAINRPRPYEHHDQPTLIQRGGKGQSFPSRHTFSAFVIAATLYQLWPGIGIILLVLAGLLALVRVLGGVHYPSDVIAGALIGILAAWIGFAI